MKIIVDDLAGNSHADPTDAGLGQAAGQMTSAEGDSLRALRTIIFKHDPGRKFGGLRRMLAPSGDFSGCAPTMPLSMTLGFLYCRERKHKPLSPAYSRNRCRIRSGAGKAT